MFDRILRIICRSSLRWPYAWLAASVVLSVPAVVEVHSRLRLDTDLTRLLPEDSPAVRWSRELEPAVGDGGVFTILFEGGDPAALTAALEGAAREVEALPAVRSVDYRYPTDFVKRFGYLLVPSDALQKLFDVLVSWKAEASPLGLGLESAKQGVLVKEAGSDEVRAALQLYTNLPEVHQSPDGRIVGMLIAPKKGMTSFGETRELMARLEAIAAQHAQRHGIWGGVGGTLRNKVDVFNLVMADLRTAGMLAGIGLVLVLAWNFRSLVVLPVVLYPLGLGLLWSFTLIPTLVGSLNTITSFLLMILLGLGVDFSIHLVKRFQREILKSGTERALVETFVTTGRSILTSGMTTAAGMIVLALSSFRGFSEYGIISGSAILVILAAVFVVLPAAMVAGARLGLVRPRRPRAGRWSLLPGVLPTLGFALVVVAAAVFAFNSLRFDYDFTELQTEDPAAALVKAKQRRVYPGSLTPAALYVVDDLAALDGAIEVLRKVKEQDRVSPTIGRLTGLREFAPALAEAAERRRILADLQDRLQGRWIRRVKDPEQRSWIESIRDFRPPAEDPRVEDLPLSLSRSVEARDGSNRLLLGVYPSVERKNGRNAIAFAGDLRHLPMPAGVHGPTGETMIFAEILVLVTHEGPWLVALTFLAIFLLVLWDSAWSVGQTLWILFPLVAGIVLTLGLIAALGWKLNFFNMIVLPNLIGMSVANGVHYYHRWLDQERSTREVQVELASPLAGAMLTTVVGFGAMLFAHHQGLRSIALTAVLGVVCCWATVVVLMAGVLRLRERRRRGESLPPPPEPLFESAFGESQIPG